MVPYPTTILLATDGSADARFAERVAVDLCARSGAVLHLVHAWLYVPVGPYPYAASPRRRHTVFSRRVRSGSWLRVSNGSCRWAGP